MVWLLVPHIDSVRAPQGRRPEGSFRQSWLQQRKFQLHQYLPRLIFRVVKSPWMTNTSKFCAFFTALESESTNTTSISSALKARANSVPTLPAPPIIILNLSPQIFWQFLNLIHCTCILFCDCRKRPLTATI